MTRLSYVDETTVEGATGLFDSIRAHMGFLPNSMRVMAHRPEIMETFGALGIAILKPGGTISAELKQLVAYAASLAAGCRYCQAHTAHLGAKRGIDVEKMAEAWNFENSDRFSEAERTAMRFAMNAASVPNAVEAEDFDVLRSYYDDAQIVEILAVVALFGFLNRWNDTLATTLEDIPTAFGSEILADGGWSAGRHGS